MKQSLMAIISLSLAALLAFGAGSSPNALVLEGVVAAPASEAGWTKASTPEFDVEVRPCDLFSLSNLLTVPEIYHDFVSRSVDLNPRRPVIDAVRAYQGDGPPGLMVDGTLVRISGRSLEATAQIMVGGKPSPPLIVTPNAVVARLSGIGITEIWLVNNRGLASSKRRLSLTRVTAERAPPHTLQAGQVYDAVLRIQGTSELIGIALAADTRSVSLGGKREMKVSSSGGGHNVANFSIRAEQAGRYRVTCRLARLP
jgi:hypothetical protein